MDYFFTKQQEPQDYFLAARGIKTIFVLAFQFFNENSPCQPIKKVNNHPIRTNIILNLCDYFFFLSVLFRFLFELHFLQILLFFVFWYIKRNCYGIRLLSDNKFLILFFLFFNFFFRMVLFSNLVENLLILQVLVHRIKIYSSLFVLCDHSQD